MVSHMSCMSTGLSRDERRGSGGGGRGGGPGGGDGGPDRVRSLRETAELLNISVATLRRRIADGAIKIVRLSPRRIGVRDSDREKFLQANVT
jgi:hypothetical protein